MNIVLEKTNNVSAVITVKMEKADYAENVKKAIKELCHKVQMPGFRPGKVPVGLVTKMYGAQVKADEVNKMLGEKLFAYIKDNNINILGEPLASDKQTAQDIEKQDDFEFVFDIALAPEFTAELSEKDTIDYYDIEVTEDQINEQVKQFAQYAGHPEEAESYEERDIVRGLLTELDENGQPKENGISVEKASLMPNYFKDEEQKKLFEGVKKNTVITFNPTNAYKGNDTEVASLLKIAKENVGEHTGNFTFQVEEISRFVPAEINQALFDQIYGKDNVKSEEEFRAKVKEGIANQRTADSDYKFLLDVRSYLEDKVGTLEFPEELLKRFMKESNPDKDEAFVEDNFAKSIEELKWHLIKEKLVAANNIKVEDKDVKTMAIQATRYQFAQYGMANIGDEYLEQYANEMLKNKNQVNSLVERCIDSKLMAALKNVVTLNHKTISAEDFGKLFD